jgi:predicted anti-sigma-YlaC factor YlaD
MSRTGEHPVDDVAAACGRRFPEELLSGYLDRALTQGERQRVRIHLEDCAPCRDLLAELAALRETAMTTEFMVPADDQWDERPQGKLSLLLRGGGWLLVVAWVLAVAGYAAWEVATGPEGPLVKLFVFGGASGAALLFFSVLVDRLRVLPIDRYRRVQK